MKISAFEPKMAYTVSYSPSHFVAAKRKDIPLIVDDPLSVKFVKSVREVGNGFRERKERSLQCAKCRPTNDGRGEPLATSERLTCSTYIIFPILSRNLIFPNLFFFLYEIKN